MAGKPTKNPPPKDQESSSSNGGEEEEEESKTGTQNTPQTKPVEEEGDGKSGGGDSDGESEFESDAGMAAKKSQEAIGTKMISNSKAAQTPSVAAGKRGRESDLAVADKVRRLRKKYRNLAERSNNGKDLLFSKAHDKKLYQLSKRIWGAKDTDEDMEDPKEKDLNLSDIVNNKSKSGSGGIDTGTGTAMVDFNRTEEMVLKDCMTRLTAEKRANMEKKLKVIQLESYLKRSRLIRKLVKSTLHAYKSK
ncbi:hypothetical protein CCACVL1_25821 [Corchorus capsularis]|uniref:Glabrous enhancer-binding protein-like DBD domain-containing protein n=1 Tax=Corchorus capsularis TaxID=210143 RepID=A0A1R3GH02_COCAP|nr:hypothetical protein CCACVL1_25821 [Corchorus capsularis]